MATAISSSYKRMGGALIEGGGGGYGATRPAKEKSLLESLQEARSAEEELDPWKKEQRNIASERTGLLQQGQRAGWEKDKAAASRMNPTQLSEYRGQQARQQIEDSKKQQAAYSRGLTGKGFGY